MQLAKTASQRPVHGCLPSQSYMLLAEPQPHPSDIQKAVTLSQSIVLLPPKDVSERVTGGAPMEQALKKGARKVVRESVQKNRLAAATIVEAMLEKKMETRGLTVTKKVE